MSPLGKVWTNCLKNHNVITMYPPVKWPLAPSENNVRLQREIFFSALTTEETTVESMTPDIVESWLVGKSGGDNSTGWYPMGYVSLLTRGLCIPRNGHITTPSLLVRIYGHHDNDHLRHHGPYDDSSYSTSACHRSPSGITIASYCSMIMPLQFLRFSQPTYSPIFLSHCPAWV